MKLLLILIMNIIIATLWGMILYGMVTSGSLVLTIAGLVTIAWLVYKAWKANSHQVVIEVDAEGNEVEG